MTATLTGRSFDYSCVDADTASKLRYFEGALLTADKAHITAIMKVGELLAGARKELEAHPEQTFRAWIAATRPYSIRTAYNYLNAWQYFGSCATVARIEPGAMYVLANSERARSKALKLTKKGETITQKRAKELVAEFSDDDTEIVPEEDAAAEPGTPEPQDEPETTLDDEEALSEQSEAAQDDCGGRECLAAAAPLVVCPHCDEDVTAEAVEFINSIVFGIYQCRACKRPFEIVPNEQSVFEVRPIVCGTNDVRQVPAASVKSASSAVRNDLTADDADERGWEQSPAASTVPYTSTDVDPSTFRTTMPPLDLSAGPADEPSLNDFETMKLGWRLHVQPIWLASDDANRRAMKDWVAKL